MDADFYAGTLKNNYLQFWLSIFHVCKIMGQISDPLVMKSLYLFLILFFIHSLSTLVTNAVLVAVGGLWMHSLSSGSSRSAGKSQTQKQRVEWWCQGLGAGGNKENCCSTSIRFQLCMMIKFQRCCTVSIVNNIILYTLIC